MYRKTKEIKLDEGKFKSEFMFFEEEDRPMLKKCSKIGLAYLNNLY